MAHLPDAPKDPRAEYFPPVGEIALRYSRLEYQLGVIIRLLIGATKQRQYRSIASKRTAALCSLINLLLPNPRTTKELDIRLKALTDATKAIEKDRNDYIHSIYGTWSDVPIVPMRFRLLADESGSLQAFQIAVRDIQTIADSIEKLQVEAQAITTAIKNP